MLPLHTERSHLSLADRHMAEGRLRIHKQIRVIRRIRADGLEDYEALALLRVLKAIQQTGRDHRRLIVQELLRGLQRP